MELLFKTVGPARCLFGTEKPGSGGEVNPDWGKICDEMMKPWIEEMDFLSVAEKKDDLRRQRAQGLQARRQASAALNHQADPAGALVAAGAPAPVFPGSRLLSLAQRRRTQVIRAGRASARAVVDLQAGEVHMMAEIRFVAFSDARRREPWGCISG